MGIVLGISAYSAFGAEPYLVALSGSQGHHSSKTWIHQLTIQYQTRAKEEQMSPPAPGIDKP